MATSSATFFRQMGGTLGTAVFLSVLFNGLPDKIAGAFRSAAATPAVPGRAARPGGRGPTRPTQPVLEMLNGGGGAARHGQALDDSSFINHLDPRLARPFLVGFSDSIDLVFLCGAACSLVALVIVWFLPEEKLRTQSGLQAQQTQAAEAAATRSEVPDGAVDAGGAAAMIPGAGSTDTPSEGEVGHGRHAIAVANGHQVTDVVDGHQVAEVANGHHPAEVAHGHHVAEVANGHHPTEVVDGQQPAEVANGHHPAQPAHGRHVARAPEEEPAGNH